MTQLDHLLTCSREGDSPLRSRTVRESARSRFSAWCSRWNPGAAAVLSGVPGQGGDALIPEDVHAAAHPAAQSCPSLATTEQNAGSCNEITMIVRRSGDGADAAAAPVQRRGWRNARWSKLSASDWSPNGTDYAADRSETGASDTPGDAAEHAANGLERDARGGRRGAYRRRAGNARSARRVHIPP